MGRGTDRRTEFFEPASELRRFIQFGFAAAHYRRRGAGEIRRLPTGRATIYYAADVRGPGLGKRDVGLYCEGPHSGGFTVTHESGELVAIKVRAGALGAMLGIPARELRDRTIDLEDVWGRRSREIAEDMASAPSVTARIDLLQRELAVRCAGKHGDTRGAIDAAAIVARDGGRVRIGELSRRCGVSERTILQRFDAGVGISPKQYARLVRLRATLTRFAYAGPIDCSDLAISCGYCDQAHMIHEFRTLIGLSPLAFRNGSTAFSPLGAPATGSAVVPACERRLYRSVGFVAQWVRLTAG
jgi:AraC-like DNA-binding protein